jgi:hypothetical protein
MIGTTTGSVGTYTLGGSGYLLDTAGFTTADAAASTAFINQSGGTIITGNATTVGNEQIGSLGLGVYNMTGGLDEIGSGTSSNLALGRSAGAIGIFNISGGTVTVSGYNPIAGSTNGPGGSGTFNINGGNVSVVKAPEVYANGYLIQTAGSYSAGSLEFFAGGAGTLSGGQLAAATSENIGIGTYTTGAASFNQSGGSNTVGADLNIAAGVGSAQFNLSGTGSLVVNGNTWVGGSSTGSAGAGTLNVSGGAMSAAGGLTIYSGSIYNQTAGTVSAGSFNIQSGGIAALQGGQLNAGAITNNGIFNWSGGTLNITNSDLTIGTGGLLGGSVTLNSGQTLLVSGSPSGLNITDGTLTLNGGGLGAQVINQSGGQLDSSNYSFSIAGNGANATTYNLFGGELDVASISVGTGGSFNWTGGRLNLTESGLTVGAGGQLGSTLSIGSGQSLEMQSNGANLLVTGRLNINPGADVWPFIETVSGSGLIYQTGGFNHPYLGLALSNGGSFSMSGGSISTNSISIDSNAAFNHSSGLVYTSQLSVNSGTYTLGGNGTLNTYSETIGQGGGVGNFTQFGGYHVVGGDLNLAADASSTGNYLLGGNSNASVGGSVWVGGTSSGIGGTGALNISGGYLSVANAINIYSGSAYAQGAGTVSAGGFNINSGGNAALGGGQLTVGSLSINGNFNWSGGTLTVGAVNVGTPSGTLYSQGTLAPGSSGLGTGRTTITGNYEQDAGSVLSLQIGGDTPAAGPNSPSNDYDNVSVSGSVVLGGTLSLSLINGFTPGVGDSFTLLTATGGITGSFTNPGFTQAGGRYVLPDGMTFQLTDTGNALILGNFAAATLTWTGGANSSWNTSSAGNWQTTGLGTSAIFSSGASVVFDNTGLTRSTVAFSTGVVAGDVAFNNTTGTYTLSGAGSISATSLSVNGSGGTTVLATNNNVSGATTIAPGATLQLGNGGVAGSVGSLSTITNNGSLVFNRYNTVREGTDFASINGTGNLAIASGTLQLNSTNAFSGTVFNAANLVLGDGEVSGGFNNAAIVNNGVLIFNRYGAGWSQGTDFSSISGSGTIIIGAGSSSVHLTGPNSFAGNFQTGANTLVVDSGASLDGAGSISVGNFGTLQLGGSVGAVNIASGGAVFILPGANPNDGTAGAITTSGELYLEGNAPLSSIASISAVGGTGFIYDSNTATGGVSLNFNAGASIPQSLRSISQIDATTLTASINNNTNLVVGSITIGTGSVFNLTGDGTGTLSVGSFTGSGTANWTSGALNLTNSSLTIGDGGVFGASLLLNSNQSLTLSGAGQSLNINGQLTLIGGGLTAPTINQSGGTFTSINPLTIAATGGNTPNYLFSGGVLTVPSINQTGGVFTATQPFTVAFSPADGGSTGSYSISGGTANFAGGLSIGARSSDGSFTQTGGAVSVGPGDGLYVGAGEFATYALAGGSLTVAGSEFIGTGDGVGTFSHTAGYNSVSGDLNVGPARGGYLLSGTGSVSVAGSVWIGGTSTGGGGAGSIVVSGGSMSVTGGITVYDSSTYDQSGGAVSAANLNIFAGGAASLSAGQLSVGSLSGTGNLNWSGGTLAITNSDVTIGPGATLGPSLLLAPGRALYVDPAHNFTADGPVALSGGALSVGSINVAAGGSFAWNSGTLNLTHGDLAVTAGGLLGPTISLDLSKSLTLSGTATIGADGSIIVNGGSFTAGDVVNTAGGSFQYITGYVNVLNDPDFVAQQLLGSHAQIVSGQNISTNGNLTPIANSTTTVTGGGLAVGGTLQVPTSVSVAIQSGTTTAATVNLSGGGVTIDGGNVTTGAITGTGNFNFVSGNLNLTSPSTALTVGTGQAVGSQLAVSNSSTVTAAGGIAVTSAGMVSNVGNIDTSSIDVGVSSSPSSNLAFVRPFTAPSNAGGMFTQTSGSTMINGVLAAGNNGTITSGSGSGVVNISGGSLYANTVLLGSNQGGSGDMNVCGTGNVTIGGGAHLNDLTVSGGTVTVLNQPAPAGEDPELAQALVGGYLSNGALNVTGGTVNSPYVKLGITSGNTGSLTETAGSASINILSAGADGTITAGSGSGVVNVSGGSLYANTVLLGSTQGGAGAFNVSGTASVTIGGGAHLNDLTVSGGTVTVLNQPAPTGEDPELAQALVGGYLTNGALNVNGGVVNSPYVKLGISAGNTGSLTQTAGAASINILSAGADNSITAGSGSGVVNVSGGSLYANTVLLGSTQGGAGAFNVSGTGNVTIGGGAHLNDLTVSGGTVTVLNQPAPAGEDPELAQALVGGYLTNGALNVNGGVVNSPNIKLGITTGNTGSLTQTAGASSINILSAGCDGTITSGSGMGVVNVSGGSLYANTVLLGSTQGGGGDMTVSGSAGVTIGGGAHLNDLTVNGGTVTVLNQPAPAGEDPELAQALVGGYLTNGALNVNGGVVNSPNLKLGISSGNTGSFTQTAGVASINILSAGADNTITAGSGNGVVNVSGGSLYANTVLLGSTQGGAGAFNVSGSANVTIGGGAHLNDLTVNGGTVTVLNQPAPAGEDPELAQALVGGYLTDGALNVNGGVVDTPNLKLGITTGNTGSLTQTAGAASINILSAGCDGTITSGSGTGVVNLSGGTLYANTVLLGSTQGGAGALNVSGTANLTIGGGAHLNDLTVSTGTVTVLDQDPQPGEDPELNRALVAGYLTNGALNVSGGVVTAPYIKLGITSGTTGEFNQTGGSVAVHTLAVGADIFPLQASGTGIANLSAGSLTATDLLVGSSAGGVGMVNLSGAASLTVTRLLVVHEGSSFNVTGGSLQTPSLNATQAQNLSIANANVSVLGGALCLPASGLTLGDSVSPATLHLPNAHLQSANATLTVASNATLDLDAAPGRSNSVLSCDSTNIAFTDASSVLHLSLGGDPTNPANAGSTFDQITISNGVFTVGGATLQILPLSNAMLNTPYPIVVAGSGGSIDSSQAFANLATDTTFAYGNAVYTVDYTPTEIDVTFSTVPEPESLGVLGLAAVSLMRRRRRGQNSANQ